MVVGTLLVIMVSFGSALQSLELLESYHLGLKSKASKIWSIGAVGWLLHHMVAKIELLGLLHIVRLNEACPVAEAMWMF